MGGFVNFDGRQESTGSDGEMVRRRVSYVYWLAKKRSGRREERLGKQRSWSGGGGLAWS